MILVSNILFNIIKSDSRFSFPLLLSFYAATFLELLVERDAMPSKQDRLLRLNLKKGRETRHSKNHLEERWEQNG